MSDSDSTFVAADDFGSRFLEFDEYTYEKPDDIENDGFAPFLPYFHPQVLHKSPSPDNQSIRLSKRRKRRAIKTGNRGDEFIATENVMKSDSSSSEDEDDDDSAEEEELYSSRYYLKQPLTARQISLHSQKYTDSASVKTLNQSDESLNPVKSSTTDLTQEQIAARQKKIDQRKETAKLKVETEKRQLVERLLKISSNGVSGRGRGRGRRIQTNDSPSREDHDDNVLASQQQSDNEVYAESAEINSTEGITPPPPPPVAEDKSECISVPDGGGLHLQPSNPNYIRFISSSRLSESTVICLPATHEYLHANFNKPTTNETPKLRMCDMGCGCVRRYECPKTGRSLCSLSCYKANLAQIQKSPTKIVST
ncbi:unnamed protein product [Trichobilharzia szidati]|nr:unnamed protein product [Trichobilharzia szidati]